jgi:uncharacterized membrane protein SirB2
MLALRGSGHANHLTLRRLSWLIESVLLIVALLLAAIIHQWPFVQAWLTAKILLLIVYVSLGSLALRQGRAQTVRTLCFASALAVYGVIIAIAMTHD